MFRFRLPDKERPVVVITRDSSIRLLSSVTVAPVTSTIRGVASEVFLDETDGMKRPCAINLHNTMTVAQNQLGRRVAQLRPERLGQLCASLRFVFGCD